MKTKNITTSITAFHQGLKVAKKSISRGVRTDEIVPFKNAQDYVASISSLKWYGDAFDSDIISGDLAQLYFNNSENNIDTALFLFLRDRNFLRVAIKALSVFSNRAKKKTKSFYTSFDKGGVGCFVFFFDIQSLDLVKEEVKKLNTYTKGAFDFEVMFFSTPEEGSSKRLVKSLSSLAFLIDKHAVMKLSRSFSDKVSVVSGLLSVKGSNVLGLKGLIEKELNLGLKK